ncbi:phytoene/squalene synthase family protein [Cellulomonas sp. ATA003]|uniref:phytoene/squalene synthase family protein n=1 Tax=Cellulomonas sp. ATA003 TaxID=3073064 RepID=UPI002873B67E|nr:phytoene/squalene synthase family protein [Cellulomonas sp. ATA003]WNB85392.1 phytoene/squalene synthase family protein [Cellulomonas sp. ATA003]
MAATTGVRLYDRTAARASRAVLQGYSTSFGLGTRLLGPQARTDIEAVYALVRIADEIVDTRGGDDAGQMLDELDQQVERALSSGWSTNLVVHAFARTARRVGIGPDVIDPFFASMRMDLTVRVHDQESYERYVYGSAEVVGLMCLAVFLNSGRRPGDPLVVAAPDVTAGARALGAAFQKVNFLRDLAEDSAGLGRSYFPGVTPGSLDAPTLAALLAEIERDAATARAALPSLPRRARLAVAATLGLYDRLAAELAATPPQELLARRVRVSAPGKVAVLTRSVLAEALPRTMPGTGVRA